MKSIVLICLISLSLFAQKPLGEEANYRIDKNAKRTSSMIQKGTALATVPEYLEKTPNGPSFRVDLAYDFDLGFWGKYNGTQSTVIEEEFFRESFLEEIRQKGSYQGKYFNAKHNGYADAKNLDGKFYPHCDLLLLTDLKKPEDLWLVQDGFTSPLKRRRGELKDMKLLLHISAEVPVLWAAKLDLSGNYQGMPVKAGGDYIAK